MVQVLYSAGMEILFAIVLAWATGVATAAQGCTNAALGSRTSVLQASLVSFAGGFVILIVICAATGNAIPLNPFDYPVWKLAGGVYGVFIVFAMAFCSPRLGAALTMTLLMVGQLLGGAVVDFFGLLEAARVDVSLIRIAGCAFALAGIIAVYAGGKHLKERQHRIRRILFAALAFAAGLASAVQTPTNAALATSIGVLRLGAWNFFVGTLILLIVVLIANRGRLLSFQGCAPWHFTGGVYGAFGVPASTAATPVLGVSLMLCFCMFGQLIGGLAVDRFGLLESPRIPIDKLRIAGAVLLGIGVVLVTISKM